MFDHVEAYHRPRSIPEAVRLLRAGGGARVVAGGTDVIVQADRGIRALVDITRLGLDYIRKNNGGWTIGSTTTMASIVDSPELRKLAGGILGAAAATCGSVQLRNMATVGGNLANASPAADLATPLLALDATVVVAGERARRKIPLEDFFDGPRETKLGGRLLIEVQIPLTPRGRTGWSFQKLGRTEVDIALVNVAAALQLDPRGRVKWARLALGAVAPTPIRARAAEAAITGHPLDAGLIDEAAAEAARATQPISDIRASADYRREMARVLTARALRECAREAGFSL